MIGSGFVTDFLTTKSTVTIYDDRLPPLEELGVRERRILASLAAGQSVLDISFELRAPVVSVLRALVNLEEKGGLKVELAENKEDHNDVNRLEQLLQQAHILRDAQQFERNPSHCSKWLCACDPIQMTPATYCEIRWTNRLDISILNCRRSKSRRSCRRRSGSISPRSARRAILAQPPQGEHGYWKLSDGEFNERTRYAQDAEEVSS